MISSATVNRLVSSVIGTGSPNLLLYSLFGSSPPPQQTTLTVAFKSMAGSFSVGGTATCVTGSTGNCTLSSGSLKTNAASSTTLTGTGVSGTLMNYDASQNTLSQIVIVKP